MSAHKRTTISISAEEYRKLHEAAMQKRFLKKELPAIKRELRQATKTAINQSTSEMNRRQQSFLETVGQLDENVRALEMRSAYALWDHQRQLWQSLDEFAGQMWNQTTLSMLEQREELVNQLQFEHDQRQSDILQISSQLQSAEQEKDRRWEIAQNWLEAAEGLREFIQDNYAYQKFTPDAYNQNDNFLNQAYQNQEQGIPEAALTGAQQAYSGFSALHIKLEELTAQWEAHYHAVIENASMLVKQMESERICRAIDLNGNELDIDINVDYWTGGKFSEQMEYVSSLIDQIETRSAILDIEMMKNLLEETFPSIEAQIGQLVAEARMKVISSQIRVNIADIVLRALQEQGYAFKASGYVSRDMRQSYLANARNLEGSEVVIQVDPLAGSETMNELHLHSYEKELRTHHELRQRAKEINQALSKRGLHVGATSTQPEVQRNILQHILPAEGERQQFPLQQGE